jgi:CRISPR-associated protein Cmr4
VGAGNSVGAVDAPVMRERHTGFPIIPGSSIKGVLADLWNGDMQQIARGNKQVWVRKENSEAAWLLGQEEYKEGKEKVASGAGALLIGEARSLIFPMRSAKDGFAWITCPLALSRYCRDAGISVDSPSINGASNCLANDKMVSKGKVILEEYCLNVIGPQLFSEQLSRIVDDTVWQSLNDRLVVVSDEMFAYFVRNASEVVTRIKVDDETGTVARGALFDQENVPSETLFYSVVHARPVKNKSAADALTKLKEKLTACKNLLQIGGDETVGLGFCSIKLV